NIEYLYSFSFLFSLRILTKVYTKVSCDIYPNTGGLVDHQSGEFLDGDVLVGEGQTVREVPERLQECEASRREVDKAAEDEDLKARKEIDLMIEKYMNGGTLADIGLKADSKVVRDVGQGDSREISQDVGRDMSRDVGGDASPLYKQNKTK